MISKNVSHRHIKTGKRRTDGRTDVSDRTRLEDWKLDLSTRELPTAAVRVQAAIVQPSHRCGVGGLLLSYRNEQYDRCRLLLIYRSRQLLSTKRKPWNLSVMIDLRSSPEIMRIIVNPDRFITGCFIPMLTLVKEEYLCWRSFLRVCVERVDIRWEYIHKFWQIWNKLHILLLNIPSLSMTMRLK